MGGGGGGGATPHVACEIEPLQIVPVLDVVSPGVVVEPPVSSGALESAGFSHDALSSSILTSNEILFISARPFSLFSL